MDKLLWLDRDALLGADLCSKVSQNHPVPGAGVKGWHALRIAEKRGVVALESLEVPRVPSKQHKGAECEGTDDSKLAVDSHYH